MSGIYLLVLFGIWLFVGWIIKRILRFWQPVGLPIKTLKITTGVLLFSVWFGWPFWEVTGKKMYYDAQVRELCAKDGGIKVYETVELPPERFNRWGQIDFYRATQHENGLGPEYLFREDIKYFRRDNPQIRRIHYEVFRRVDGKLLGETVIYDRGGGDLCGPWQPSGFFCPDINRAGEIDLFTKIFILSKGAKK
jgi:hypothetical protein